MELKWIPEAAEAYRGLSSSWKRRTDEVLDSVSKNPGRVGDHMTLEAELFCNHRVHVSNQRVVYRVFPNMDIIAVMGVGPKLSAYAMARRAFEVVWNMIRFWRRPGDGTP